mgnify:CR=1 FL=1|jgi:hypothetical protein
MSNKAVRWWEWPLALTFYFALLIVSLTLGKMIQFFEDKNTEGP